MSTTTSAANWDEVDLGDIVTLHRGYDLPSGKRRDGPIPIVSSSGITGYHDEAKISPPGVVTGRYGTLGEVFFVQEPFWPLNTTLYVSDFHGNDQRFVSYFLRCQGLGSRDGAAAVPGINRNVLHRLPARRPPLATQRKIAATLSAYDDLIDNNNRRIKLLEEMFHRIHREWLVDYRYPGREKVPLVDSTLGPIPKGWEWMELGQLAAESRLVVDPGSVAPTTPYVGLEHMPQRSIAIAEWGLAAQAGSQKYEFKAGDVLFGKIRPYFHKVAVSPVDGICSTDAIVIRSHSPKLSGLVLAVVSSDAFVEEAVQTSQGTKMPRANWNVLQRYPVALPPPVLIESFGSYMDRTVAMIHRLVMSNRNLGATRDLLLPRLISGGIDVSDIEIAMPDAAA